MIKEKISHFFKYSIGEIIIVVLGVLIAIQLNNWNEGWNEDKRIENYFDRVQEEIKLNYKVPAGNGAYTMNTIIPDLKTAGRIIRDNESDSLAVLFEKIKWLTESELLSFQYPIIEEFVAKGYLSEINDSKLNELFVYFNYVRSQCDITDEMTRDYQIQLIKPFLIKHTHYASLDYYNTERQFDDRVAQDLGSLLKNVELENLISLYITHLERAVMNFGELSSTLERINERIKEIQSEAQ